MICWETMVAILAALSVSVALAEDFTTTNGREFKDATITRVEGDGIIVRTKTGISKIYFFELPKEVQQRFHYDQAAPMAAPSVREPAKLDTKQEDRRKSDGGPKVVVVGQSFFNLKVVAGILALVVVVLAIIRSRL